jgi:leucyl/phenylalanyl-tRNA---protein transferase
MTVLSFPPIDQADENGLLAIGGDLEVGTLLMAYRQGIFPWPISKQFPLAWFSPDPRGILDIRDLKINKRFKRFINNHNWRVTFNQSFEEVVRECSLAPRQGQEGTWITEDIIQGYQQFFHSGHAYSVEVWEDQELIGGLYGVFIDGNVSGESMFFKKSNASKLALYSLMKRLEKHGIQWLDTQMVTPVVKDLGGKEICREEFLKRIQHPPFLSLFQVFNDLRKT